MPIREQKRYRFQEPKTRKPVVFSDLTSGLDTESPLTESLITKAQNVRFLESSLFTKRKGTLQRGNTIGASSNILGLHSYVKKNNTAELLATYNTDIYRYTEANTPATIATTTNSQGTGYSKDRHVFMTTAHTDATNNLPFCAVLYQNGTGIRLEWEDAPYGTWSNTVIDVTTDCTTIEFDAFMDTSDNIHVTFKKDSTDDRVMYVKLTYGSGPTWSVGTAQEVDSSTFGALTKAPSIFVQPSGRVFVAWMDAIDTEAPAKYGPKAKYSDDGTTFFSTTGLEADYSANEDTGVAVKVLGNGTTPTVVVQDITDGATYRYYYYSWSGSSWGTRNSVTTSAAGTLREFTAVYTGTTLNLDVSGNSTSGLSTTAFGSSSGAQLRKWSVANDGVNDNDIQYKNVINGSEDATATRVTNDSNNNKFPSTPEFLSATPQFTPVVFVEGTGSPYNIKINSATQWVALSQSLTAGSRMNSCTMPSTAAGGTDQHYFVNGSNTPRKWNGSVVTAATATGYPVAAWIFAMDNRLWMGGASSTENTAWYTALGSDSFTGTFPSGNRVDFPESTVWGHWYRDSTALIFTRLGVYTIRNFDYTGASVGPEKIRKIPDSYGTLAGRTVYQLGGWVYYQRPDGQIMRTNSEWAELVSGSISPTLAGLSLSQLQNAAAGGLGDYYYLAVTDSGSGQNDLIVVLNTKKAPRGGFSIDTGKSASVFATHPDQNGVPLIYYGSSPSSLGAVYQMEIGTSDAGSAIDMDLMTGVLPLSEVYYSDILRDMLVIAEASGDYDLTVGVAPANSINSFTNYAVNLDPEAGVWGDGVWDTSRVWGGNSHVSTLIPGINITSTGHRIRFRNNAADQSVAVITAALAHETVKDR